MLFHLGLTKVGLKKGVKMKNKEEDYKLFENFQTVILGKKMCGCPDHDGYRVLDLDNFYPKQDSASGLQSWCKVCDKNRGKNHLKATVKLPDRYKKDGFDFSFEIPGRKNEAKSNFFIKVTSSHSGTTIKGNERRSLDIYFSHESFQLLEILGERVSVAFDWKNKKIALVGSELGWKIAKAGGSVKTPKKQLKILRDDAWGKVSNINLSSESVIIKDNIVILDINKMV